MRTKKESGDKATNYLYDGGANIIMETDKDNKVSAKNIRGLKLIYRESYANSITDPTYLYYLHNAHGDVTQLLNEQGEVIKDYRYDPFGEEQSVESLAFGGKQATELWRQEIEEIDNPFRYAGEYQDTETGNYYLRARYYDPTIQRFINEDSYSIAFGAAWGDHLYSYAKNNPIRFIDPTGHLTEGQTLQYGSKGKDVEMLQKRLVAEGYLKMPKGVSYGYFGSLTKDAVDRFKNDKGLWNTGKNASKVGETTWKALSLPVNRGKVTSNQATNRNGSSTSPKGKGQTGQKSPNVNRNDNKREAVKLGATDSASYGVDGAIEEGSKLIGKTVSSQVGNVYSGITTGFDVNDTLDNEKYTTGQKAAKVTIQILGGGANVAFGTVVGGVAVGTAPETGGASIVGGAVVIGGFSYGVNRAQNWLYDKLGL